MRSAHRRQYGIFVLDRGHVVKGRWEQERGPQYLA
jgi:hypothetical protein